MLVAPEHIKAASPEDAWYPNGRDEVQEALNQLNSANDGLQQEANYEDIRE